MNKPILINFVLGKCNCGFCNNDIPIRNTNGFIQKYKYGHNPAGYTNMKGVNHPKYTGGRRILNGYIEIYKPEHPYRNSHDCVFEHRLVVEEYYTKKWGYKFYLHPSVHVHHINRKTQDNRFENLRLMIHSEHRKLHCSMEEIIDRSSWFCDLCNKKTTVFRKLKNGMIQPLYYRYKENKHICSKCYDIINNERAKQRRLNKKDVNQTTLD